MASQDLEKYRSINTKDRTNVLPGDTLYLNYVGETDRHMVTVIAPNNVTCVVRLPDGAEQVAPWDRLEVLA